MIYIQITISNWSLCQFLAIFKDGFNSLVAIVANRNEVQKDTAFTRSEARKFS